MLAAGMLAALAATTGQAAAEITRGAGCLGSATIDGVTYTQDQSRGDAIEVPADTGVVIPYSGSVEFENLANSGRMWVVIGPWRVTVADWGDANTADDRATAPDSTYALDDFYDRAPNLTGLFVLGGEHDASGGGCAGEYLVRFAGNPFTSPVTVVGLVGAAGSAALVVLAGRARGLPAPGPGPGAGR